MASPRRFPCTPGGSVAAGRRRLRALLLGPCLLMLAVTAASWWSGRLVAGLLALAVALAAFVAWRMSEERLPLWLALGDGELQVRTRTALVRLPTAGATARRLGADERQSLERLTSVAGVALSGGGFDSRLLGDFELHASNLDHAVLVETEERRLVVTPDDPDGFLELFRARIPPS